MEHAPPPLADAASRELAGERVLWATSPAPWAYARKYWATAAFGIPFFAFSLFWEYQVLHGPTKGGSNVAMVFFPLWGLPFVAAGMGMLLSPFYAAWKARRVYYVITERRAVIFEKSLALKIHSFDASGFGGFERVSRGGDGGNIIFQRTIERHSKGTTATEVGFIGLRSFASAEQALRQMMELRSRP